MGGMSDTISEQLRNAIRGSGLTVYELAKQTGISSGQLYRFINGDRELRSSTMDELAAFFGMRLTKPKRHKKGTQRDA